MNSKKAGFFVIAAGVLWGSISLFVNALSAYSLSSMEMNFLRMAVCAVVMFFAVLFYNPRLFKIELRDIWMFLGTGLLSLVFFSWCYFTVIIESEASVAVSLLYTSPVWVMLFSAVLFKEKLSAVKLTAVPVTVLGCALVAGLIGSGAVLTPKVILAGLGAGIGYALYSVFGRFATKKYSSLTITFYTFLFAAIGFIFLIKPVQLFRKCTADPKILVISLFLGLVCGVLPYIFYTIGLNHMETSTAAILVAVEPLVGCIVGIAVFKDSVTPSKLAGIALILSSIIILNLNLKKTRKAEG